VVQSGAEIVCPERAGAECAAALPRAAVIQRLALRVRPSALALVSAILASPALLAGWNLDDHLFRHRLAAWPLRDVLMRLFVFWSGDAEETRQTMDRWGVPWWTDPGLRVAFWRPLTALTHWLDFRLWGDDPVAAHAQSLLWLVVLVVLVARFYRRLLGPTTAAGLAAFFYAVDGARGAAVGWVASRNAILVVVCGVATLAQHDRWRRNGRRAGALLGPLLFGAGLLAGEGEVGVLGYLAAYALFLDGGDARARLRSLAPYLVLLVGWHALYQHLGYGTAGSGFYADPAREPLRFVATVLERGPVLLFSQWWPWPAELYSVVPVGEQGTILVCAAVALLVPAVVLAPLLAHRPTARFWALGMAAAVVPISATIPEDRLLVFVGLGTFGLLGELVSSVWLQPAAWLPRERGWRWPALGVVGALFLVHGVASPSVLPGRAREVTTIFPEVRARALAFPTGGPDEQAIVVQGGLSVGFYYPEIRLAAHLGIPRWRVLAPEGDVRLTRPDARTLRVRPRGGYLAEPASDDYVANQRRRFDTFVRTPDHPFALGDTVHLTGVDVEVTALDGEGRPAEATFRFAVPLEDASLRWAVARGDGWAPFRPPAVGESVLVEAAR
jgi:hypothetical protein